MFLGLLFCFTIDTFMITYVLSLSSLLLDIKIARISLSDSQVSTPVLLTNQSTLHIVARNDLSLKYSLSARVEN